MKKSAISFSLAALALSFTALNASAQETIRIGTEGAYPPFNYFMADGQLAGFDVEIGKAICADMKVE